MVDVKMQAVCNIGCFHRGKSQELETSLVVSVASAGSWVGSSEDRLLGPRLWVLVATL